MKESDFVDIMLQPDKAKREAMVDELSGPEAREFVKRLLNTLHRMGNIGQDALK